MFNQQNPNARRKRSMADMLAANAFSGAPAYGGPLEALARIGTGYFAGRMGRQADDIESASQRALLNSLAGGMGGQADDMVYAKMGRRPTSPLLKGPPDDLLRKIRSNKSPFASSGGAQSPGVTLGAPRSAGMGTTLVGSPQGGGSSYDQLKRQSLVGALMDGQGGSPNSQLPPYDPSGRQAATRAMYQEGERLWRQQEPERRRRAQQMQLREFMQQVQPQLSPLLQNAPVMRLSPEQSAHINRLMSNPLTQHQANDLMGAYLRENMRASGVALQYEMKARAARGVKPKEIRVFEEYYGYSPQKQEDFREYKHGAKGLYVDVGGKMIKRNVLNTLPHEIPKTLPPGQQPGVIADQTRAKKFAEHQALWRKDEVKTLASIDSMRSENKVIYGVIGKARDLADGLSVGPLGGLLSNLPSTAARRLEEHTEVIKTKVAFALMRDVKEFGGGVGSLTEGEREAMGNSLSALSQATTVEEYLFALDNIQWVFERAEKRKQATYELNRGKYGSSLPAGSQDRYSMGGNPASGGAGSGALSGGGIDGEELEIIYESP